METSVAETEDLISVLDNDVTELDALVATLQEENAQLQQTVNLLQLTDNFLLQRVAALEAAVNITNNTLDGIVYFFVRFIFVALYRLPNESWEGIVFSRAVFPRCTGPHNCSPPSHRHQT